MFEIMDTQTQEAVIKVIGIGGCGGNAVDHMIQNGARRRVHLRKYGCSSAETQPGAHLAANGIGNHQRARGGR